MKKISILGKQIPAFVIAMLVIAGLGSAALVGYISNTITADIEVESPMLAGVSLGKTSWAGDRYPEGSHTLDDWTTGDTPLTISDIYGGETITVYTMSANLADAHIWGFEEAIVTNLDGVTCDDFESVIVSVDSIYGDQGYGTEHELIDTGGCQQVTNDPNRVQFGSPDNSDWNVGETDVSKMVVTFKTNAVGTYTLTYRVIPAI